MCGRMRRAAARAVGRGVGFAQVRPAFQADPAAGSAMFRVDRSAEANQFQTVRLAAHPTVGREKVAGCQRGKQHHDDACGLHASSSLPTMA